MGFSVVAYLDNSHSHIFDSFWRLHKVYFRSNKGVTIHFEQALVILSLTIYYFFFFALGKWFGVLHLLLRLCRLAARGLIFIFRSTSYLLSRHLKRWRWMLPEDRQRLFVRVQPEVRPSLQRGVGSDASARALSVWREGKLRLPWEGEFNGATEWEHVRLWRIRVFSRRPWGPCCWHHSCCFIKGYLNAFETVSTKLKKTN